MTDITAEIGATPPRAEHLASFSPDRIEAGRAAWLAAGLDGTKYDLAVVPPAVGPKAGGADVAATIAALQAAGQAPEAIAALLERHGLTAAPDDTRTDAERDFDVKFPAPSPADYRPDWYGRADGIEDLAAVNADWGANLAAMGLPVRVGEYVAERAIDLGRWYAGASEAERALWVRGERHDLEAKAGVEGAALYVRMAAAALAKADPAFVEKLRASGALHSREIVTHLAHQGARLERRGG